MGYTGEHIMKLANQDKLEKARPIECRVGRYEAICDVCGSCIIWPDKDIVFDWAYGHRETSHHNMVRFISDGRLVARLV